MIKKFYAIVSKDGSYHTHHRSWTMPALYRTKGIAKQYANADQQVIEVFLVPAILKELMK